MREQIVDILSRRVLEKANAICFTSNGIVKSNGALVMGAGVAKAFQDEFDGIDTTAGYKVQTNGNICQIVDTYRFINANNKIDSVVLVAFPTKYDYRNSSDIELIKESARQLMALVEENDWKLVALPRPGCRNGGLDWNEVKRSIDPILDDRIVIVTRA